jgi:hypothetical protein
MHICCGSPTGSWEQISAVVQSFKPVPAAYHYIVPRNIYTAFFLIFTAQSCLSGNIRRTLSLNWVISSYRPPCMIYHNPSNPAPCASPELTGQCQLRKIWEQAAVRCWLVSHQRGVTSGYYYLFKISTGWSCHPRVVAVISRSNSTDLRRSRLKVLSYLLAYDKGP